MYTLVRGVRILTSTIDEVEQTFGAKLVSDEKPELLLNLDKALYEYYQLHQREPDVIQLIDFPELLFKPMVLNIEVLGMSVPGSYRKPAWFYFKKNHPIYKLQKQY